MFFILYIAATANAAAHPPIRDLDSEIFCLRATSKSLEVKN